MNLYLLREYEKRFPSAPPAKTTYVETGDTCSLAERRSPYGVAHTQISHFCTTGPQASHHSCHASWCKCPCHDWNGDDWTGMI